MYFVFFGDYVGISINSGNFWDMLEMQRDAKKGKQMDADGNTLVFKPFYDFFTRLEDVDPINLEPQSSIKLRKHKVT